MQADDGTTFTTPPGGAWYPGKEMKRVWELIYSAVVIPLLWSTLQVMGFVNRKIRKGIRARYGLFASLEGQVRSLSGAGRVWFHSSSLGEFEQAKPIIAELKRRHPELTVIVTFFSPSGYEHSRKYHVADVISYIPFDTRKNARRFLDLVKPDAAVMVRYDVWPNHIWELSRRRIPILIANATMRRQTSRRIPLIRSFHTRVYDPIDKILTVSATDAEAFSLFDLHHPVIEPIGDTRYDQVSTRSAEARRRHIIPEHVVENKLIVVAGSSWPEDESVLIPAFARLLESFTNLLLIIVPHEPTVEHIENLEDQLDGTSSTIRFSGLNEYRNERVIIVDSVGILLTLYAYAHVAYVGGSFKQGVHNTLEAAVFGVPVLFGPRHRNSSEPLQLVNHGGAFVVNDTQELYRTVFNLLENSGARESAGSRAADFVQHNVGATERFLQHLSPYLSTPAAEVNRTSLFPERP
ncbi:MAG: 3-deoxy-D-manno-octulosonic acid transferase [Ignavibacteria bacterium]|nr:3-deoxy-D-manno-octulosonic acid transferase [Ignavibacteria bacterium]